MGAGCYWHLVGGGQGLVLNVLRCTTKSHLVQTASSAEVGSPGLNAEAEEEREGHRPDTTQGQGWDKNFGLLPLHPTACPPPPGPSVLPAHADTR